MTVAGRGNLTGRLLTIKSETRETSEAEGKAVSFDNGIGKVFADLKIGADILGSRPLLSNSDLGYMGVIPVNMGFVITKEQAQLFGYEVADLPQVIKKYMNGSNLTSGRRDRLIIDFFQHTQDEAKTSHPRLYQLLLDEVKPFRDQVRRQGHREKWWLFGEQRHGMRLALSALPRYVATIETSKHRTFSFMENDILPDQKLRVVALADGWPLSVLSSKFHTMFSDAAGGRLGVGNDPVYNGTRCFDPFPFPDLTDAQKATLCTLGEDLDAHRKRQQVAHPKLTLTQMYNVLEKLRAGEVIEGKDKEIYDQGLIGILRDLHHRIDAVVADAYGWPVDLSDEDILLRLVALNKERAEEEARGHIRWLRPEYQNPTGQQATKGKTSDMDLGVVAKIEKSPWPKTMPEQIAAVREALYDMGEATPAEVARRFVRARAGTVEPLMESLAALGQAERGEDGRYAA